MLGRPPGELRLVTAHLGNGCSATAVRDGVSVDTTMGLTPLDGLVMGTRSGDVDPGLLGYLAERTGMDVDELTRALNTDSGLQGLSGVGNDMRTVVAAAADGNERAQLALDVFVHRLSKAIAGLVVGLERLDALVFTGGIGENSAVVRSMVLSRLGFLGLAEDVQANAGHGRETRRADQPCRPGPGARRADRRGTPDRPGHRRTSSPAATAGSGELSCTRKGGVMARTLLVVPSAAGAGLARTCLGVVRALDRRGVNVGFVKPVAQPRQTVAPTARPHWSRP